MTLTTEQLIDRLGVTLEDLLREVRMMRADLADRPTATSSCEIKSSARGADVTVKAYSPDVTEACDQAVEEYVRVTAEVNQKLAGALNGGSTRA